MSRQNIGVVVFSRSADDDPSRKRFEVNGTLAKESEKIKRTTNAPSSEHPSLFLRNVQTANARRSTNHGCHSECKKNRLAARVCESV